ncbi:MAG: hypothetical protein M1828_006026 [Chrysothrix sp. TS-e1954]|nr:MAG: hypothetical protein M1828_006026 [Chrysothrix sp. TS-e1954]
MAEDTNREADRQQRDLLDYAQTTNDDLYSLLSLPRPSPDTADDPITDTHLKAAWRRTALRHHPDKNRGDEEAATRRYNAARLAHEVLKEPELRAKYDARITREREARARTEQFDARRRQMKHDLETREQAGSPIVVNGTKRRAGGEEETPEAKREREIARLAAEGRKRRMDREDAARRTQQQQREETEREHNGEDVPADSSMLGGNGLTPEVSEVDRTIKVRWRAPKPGEGSAKDLNKDRLKELFTRFGDVQSVVLLKDKKSRPSTGISPLNSPTENIKIKQSKRELMRTAIVVFSSVVGAHAAVSDSARLVEKGVETFKELDSVFWANGSTPDLGLSSAGEGNSSRGAMDDPFVDETSRPHTPILDGASERSSFGLNTPVGSSASLPEKHGTPSFTFTPKSAGTPGVNGRGGNKCAGGVKASPSLYEVTMMRLKEAEPRKMEDSIRKSEAEQEA